MLKNTRAFFALCLSLLLLASAAFTPQASASLYDQDGNTVWRFGSKHEAGDIEDNELYYIVFNSNHLVSYSNDAEGEAITVYQITKKNSSGFSASPVEAYSIENKKDSYGISTPHAVKIPLEDKNPINVSVSGNALRIAGSSETYKKTDGWCTNYIPETLHKYLNKAQRNHQ